jgi:hypothetical protein
LLEWLARQDVQDLRIEPLGLAGIYHQYHSFSCHAPRGTLKP